jgi:hypothetical protein
MDDKPRESAGQQFARWLKPGGCVLVLVISILMLVTCFTAGRNPIPGYAPPQTSEYYAAHLDELKAELEEHVFPELKGAAGCSVDGARLKISIESDYYGVTRSAILRYYDADLFEFVEKGK